MEKNLFALNFQDLLHYDVEEVSKRGPCAKYEPPLACSGFCVSCETKKLLEGNEGFGAHPPLISHGCSSSEFETILGLFSPHAARYNICTTKRKVLFLLESPGSWWDSGVPMVYEGFQKQPPTKLFYWTPYELKHWPEPRWNKPRGAGEYYGDYFAYLMVRHGLTDVYITDLQKCSWNNQKVPDCMENCVSMWLSEEIKIYEPDIVFCFSNLVYNKFTRRFGSLKSICLYHPTAINLSQRYHMKSSDMVLGNDESIRKSLSST